MGEETDGAVESISKMQEKLKALTGVDILTDSGAYKDTYTILKDIAEVWDEMDSMDQAAALELMAGKNRANTLAAILNNMEDLEGAYESALNAEGSALKENEAYLDSVQGRIDLFTNSVQKMWMNFLNTDAIKFVVDLGTGIINLIDKIGVLPSVLAGVAIYFTAIKKNNPVTIFKDLVTMLQNYNNTIKQLQTINATVGPLGSMTMQQFDAGPVNAYAAAVSNLSAKQQAATLAAFGLNSEQIKSVLTVNGLDAANVKLAMSEANVAQAKTQNTTATGLQIAAAMKQQGTTISQNAANFLLEHSTEEVTKAMLAKAVVAGKITHQEAVLIMKSMGVVAANNAQAFSWKALGIAIKSAFMSNPVGMILTIATTIASVLIPAINNANQAIKDAADDAINKYKEAQDTLSSNKQAINDLKSDYQVLANGVDEFGNNISLTTSQYERYNEIVNKIADMFPQMVRGYTAEGNAIIKNKGNIEQLTEAYKALKEQANNDILHSASDIMKNYKNIVDGNFWSFDNSTSENISASKLLKRILSEQDTFDFDEFGREYRADEYDTILYLLDDAGISRDDGETNADYVKRAISKFPGIVQSIINAWDAVVDSATSNVRPLVSAYLDTSVGYEGLTDNQKSIFDSIASSFDSDFFSKFNGDVTKMYQTIENMILNLKTSGIDDEYSLVLNTTTQFNSNEISAGDYQKQIQGFVDQIDSLLQQGVLTEDDVKYIKMSLGFEFDTDGNIQSDINTMINHAKTLVDRSLRDKILTLHYSDLQIVNSDQFNVDGTVISTWKQLQKEIEQAKIAMTEDFTTDNFTDYAESISKISSNISTYQEALEKLESGTFTLTDFTDLISEFPDLADGVDASSKSFTGLSRNLRKAIRTSPDDLVDELKDLREQLVLAGKSTASIDQLITSIENMPVDIVRGLTDEYITLADQINEAKVAQTELQEAMSENPNEGFETRGDAIEQMKELMKEGKIGSESELWDIAEAFGFTYDSAKTINENADALAKFIAARQDWYKTDEDGNYTFDGTKSFLNDVEKVVANNEKLQKMGVTWNYNDKTGALDLDFNNANWDEIVQILGESKELAGLTSEEFYDLLMQVGQFFEINWQDADDLLYYLQQINNGAESAAENFDATKNAVASFLESNGYSTDLLELTVDDDEFKKLPEDIQKVLEEYYELKKKFEEDPLSISWQLDKNKGQKLTKESIESLSQLTTIVQDNQSGTVFIDYTHLANTAREAGYAEEAIDDMIAKIKEYDNVCGITTSKEDPLGLVGLQADAKKTEQYLTALQLKFETVKNADNTVAYKIDVESVIDALIAQGWTTEQIQAYLTTLQNSGTYSFTIDGAEINVNDTDAQTKIHGLIADKEQLSVGESTEYTVTGTGEASVDHIKAMWDVIPQTKSTNYTIYETTKAKRIETPSSPINTGRSSHGRSGHFADGTAHAQGSWGAPRTETALMGELGPELVVRNGRWFTVGEHGASFEQIKQGDIIFNHKQTEDLLSQGYVTGRGKLHGHSAFASGTAYVEAEGTFSSYDFDDNDGYKKYDVNQKIVDSYSNAANEISTAANSLDKAASDISDSSDEFREVFDWIEVRLEEINEDISLRSAQLENKVGHKAQNKTIDKIIDLNQKLYDNLIAGSNKYHAYANKLLSKVPTEYRKAAQDGTIAIETFVGEADEKTLEAIQEYREWVQKGDEAAQQAEETLTEISNLAKQAIDNIAQDYDNKRSLRDNKVDQYEAYNEFLETDQGFESASIYQAMIKENNKIISGLEQQRNKMQEELNKRVESGEIKVGSQDWYDAVNEIAAVDTEIINLKTDTENYQDAINELRWDKFDALIGRIEAVSEETENMIDILSNNDLVDESGNWTDEGIASLGLYAQQMEAAEVQAKKYADEIKWLNENWQEQGYTEEEYLERLDELKSGQHDAIQAYHDSKDAIVDLNKERVDAIKNGIEKEIEAYEELIEKKKEELDAEKDLHDFQKSIMEQEKDVADLKRQLAALSADNSASARAKKAQLEAEIAEAEAALQESYYDRSISNQQEALDKELENFQEEKDAEIEGWDEYLENTNQVVADSLATVQANTDTVFQTLRDMAQEYGLDIQNSITSAIIDPWADGVTAISTFTEQFGDSMSATVEELIKLEAQFVETMATIELSGQDAVAVVKDNADKYVEAKNPEPEKNNSGDNPGDTSAAAGLVSSLSGNIQYGQTGDKVKKLQQALNELGYGNSGTKSVDGIFGSGTQSAVKKFQKDMGIAVDGIVGPETKKKFKAKGYASGSKGVDKDQWALIDELGEELVLRAQNGRLTYLEKGSGVVPADLTENLMSWGQLDPRIMIDQNRPSVGVHPEIHNTQIQIDNSIAELIHIDHCDQSTLPDVEKIVNNALEKHTQKLNNSLRKYTR